MNWHPLTLILWSTDAIGWMIYLPAVISLLALLPGWQPAGSDRAQLRRERRLELTFFQGNWVLALQVLCLVLLVAGISWAWAHCIPGAMCGTGVLAAMGPAGERTLVFRSAAVGIFWVWHVLVHIDQSNPEAPLATVCGRLLLLPAPLMMLASISFGQAVARVQSAGPATCCAGLYERPAAGMGFDGSAAGPLWLGIALAGAALVALWCWLQRRRLSSGPLALAVGAWLLLLPQALRWGVAPFVYEVLWHPCLWCLFLPEHRAVGLVLFGAPALIALEITAAAVACHAARRCPRLAEAADDRAGRATARAGWAALAFLLLAGGQVALWRVRSGVWLF